MHRGELRLDDAAPVLERQVGEDEYEIPVLVEHPIACGLHEVQRCDGRFLKSVIDDDEVPVDLPVSLRQIGPDVVTHGLVDQRLHARGDHDADVEAWSVPVLRGGVLAGRDSVGGLLGY
ncbi:hypothetical protein GCM10009762_29210 [Dermacoccus barathri]|uniref:Uncharacterized protein n=1 Tax=Dermacoccus barathri TaxID=322601 RepID=A0ABN2CAR0_9MICO